MNKLLFRDYTLADFCDHFARGYRGDVVAVVKSKHYEISFYTPTRLMQTVQDEPILAVPGLVIVPEISPFYMRKAFSIMCDFEFNKGHNFFNSLTERNAIYYQDYRDPDFDIEDPEITKYFKV